MIFECIALSSIGAIGVVLFKNPIMPTINYILMSMLVIEVVKWSKEINRRLDKLERYDKYKKIDRRVKRRIEAVRAATDKLGDNSWRQT